MTPNILHLYSAAQQADDDFQHELEALFGRNAGDARYDQRGESTPRLHLLAQRKIESYAAYRRAAFPHAKDD